MLKRSFACLLLVGFLSGCSTFSKQSPIEYVAYTYEQPYDLVFLKAFEVLDSDDDWAFSATQKQLGIIDLRNMNYSNWFGLDRQYARFLVKRVSATETSVEIDPAHTSCKDRTCVELLERVNKALSALPARPKKEISADSEFQEAALPPAV